VADPSLPRPPDDAAPAAPTADTPNGPSGPEPEPFEREGRGPSRTARARAQAEHLKARADDTVRQLEAKRPSSRIVDAAFATLERDVTNGGGVLAAALAFRIFIFMVPYVFVIVTAFPFASDAADQDPAELADKFGMAGLASTAIRSASELSFWHRVALLVVGLFALVLASRSLVRVLRITHGLAWSVRVPKLKKSTRAALVLILVVFAMLLFGSVTASVDIGVIGLLPGIVSGCAAIAIWLFVQWHLPHKEGVTWKEMIPGAVLVGVGIEALQLATVVYFTRSIESKSATYGAIGAALAILLWAYILGRIIVSGAMLNAVLWEQQQRGTARRRVPGARPSAPPRPEEHDDPRREHRHDDGLDVEREVRVIREQDQDRPTQ
jgi:uncharacterized BrkB/YihY/UPF0761 family membrane protein